jgi:hypothetical protein
MPVFQGLPIFRAFDWREMLSAWKLELALQAHVQKWQI